MVKPVITTRTTKGSALTWTEGDANLTNLQDATISIKAGTGGTSVSNELNGELTLVAGTGISLSGDNTAKTITVTATTPTAISVLSDDTTNATYYPLVSAATFGNAQPRTDSGLTYNPSTGVLTATAFSGAINGTVGATTASTGAFTTLSASSTVSGTGFTNRFASPGPIGSTTASTGAFTTLSATGTTTLATTLTGVLKAASGVVSTATAGTDYQSAQSVTGIVKSSGTTRSAAVAGTDYIAPSGALGTPSSGNLQSCTADGTNSVGFRSIPSAGAGKTSSYTLANSDRGEFVQVDTGGSIVVPQLTFAAGDVVIIYNNTAGAVTLTTSNLAAAYIGGINSSRTSVSLATRGVCNILYLSATTAVLTGNIS
jgi:hypothetical protein